MLAGPVHMERDARQCSPLQGRAQNSWSAVVVGCRNVKPHSLSMHGIDALAHLVLCASSLHRGPLHRGWRMGMRGCRVR